jgi:hypothetical protein
LLRRRVENLLGCLTRTTRHVRGVLCVGVCLSHESRWARLPCLS